MTESDQYVLGYRQAEQERLQQQAQQLAHESSWLFDQIPVARGARVVEIGCGPHGCLDLLSTRVGPAGRVVGVERNAEAAALAHKLTSQRNLGNVEVLEGLNPGDEIVVEQSYLIKADIEKSGASHDH